MKKIGQRFIHKNVLLLTREEYDGCVGCYFYQDYDCVNRRFSCTVGERNDDIGVIFELCKFKYGK